MVSSSSNTFSLSLILFISFFSLFSPSQSHSKVSLELYYESLCPYSANFIVNYLPKIFKHDLLSIVDLKLVPWGNAKLRGNSTFDCQHGPYECLLNTVEACAIDIWPQLEKHFSFIYCVEDLAYQGKRTEWESCFEKLGLDSKLVNDCYRSERGNELELKYADETNALQPPHKYVPWVVVDGEPLYEDYENFLTYICKAYQGTDAPKSCTQASYIRVSTIREVEAKAKHSFCVMERVMPTWEKIRSTVASWMSQMNFLGEV
ncbi:putative gamma interferon inducible lysosomal thiol reductase GILT [Medicago truncatula]|uniref:Gamma interferon inducible lysosomal thiol reductase n=1 Tax=Medicago truncatula TaxID=3880 RepID=G7J0S1_MEDTR|nr:gamma-interferon-responsive lysosomal thiol protein [Medicago truncatula]AES69589.1 gamma interferon inducible lysosomal thiol reductase [Medicago truncatula]RHN67736.1 putative gamma interferon inducible lysosomal thiol reductase GILT [Medicago truncatula]